MPYSYMSNEIISKLGYLSLRRRPSEIILFQRVELKACLDLFRNHFRGLLQLINIFQHIQYR